MATIKTNKPKTPRKSTKSAMPLKKKFRVNKWAALGIVSFLALIGVYAVRQSHASTTLVYGIDRMHGGGVSGKIDGKAYRMPGPSGVYIHDARFPSGTTTVCAHVRWFTAGTINFGGAAMYGVNADSFANPIYHNAGVTDNICLRATVLDWTELNVHGINNYGVDTIYSKN